MKSVLRRILIFGLIAGACVGGAAVPASATPTDEAPHAESGKRIAGGTLNPHEGLDLGPGKVVQRSLFESIDFPTDAGGKPAGVRVEWMPYRRGYAVVAFPIRELGHATDYWLQTKLYISDTLLFNTSAWCAIFHGEPGTPGAKMDSSAPFQCETTRHGWDNDFDFRLNVADATAESSGTIRTEGSVSLADGTYVDNGISFFMKGAESVEQAGQTRFSSVLRGSDPFPGAKAVRSEFQYRIRDNGGLTYYTLFGWNNSRGEQECTVRPADRYDCTVDGHSESVFHWDSTFTVAKKTP